VTKRKTQEEIDAKIARYRMLTAAMDSLSKEEQVAVIEDAMTAGRMPVPVSIKSN